MANIDSVDARPESNSAGGDGDSIDAKLAGYVNVYIQRNWQRKNWTIVE